MSVFQIALGGLYNGIGFNLNACDGNFGVLEESEKAIIIFKDYNDAKKALSFDHSGHKFIDLVIYMFNNHSQRLALRIE